MTKREQLEQRNNELRPIINAIFQTSEEIDEHRKATKLQRKEYHDNFTKIKKLKWELMSPEEQANRIETIRKIMTKTSTKSQKEILETIQGVIKNEGGL